MFPACCFRIIAFLAIVFFLPIKRGTVDVPASNLKKDIAKILLDEGYIKAYSVEEDGKQGVIHITLKYLGNKEKVICM